MKLRGSADYYSPVFTRYQCEGKTRDRKTVIGDLLFVFASRNSVQQLSRRQK